MSSYEVGTHIDLTHLNAVAKKPVLKRITSNTQRSVGTHIVFVFVKAFNDAIHQVPVSVR